MMIYNKEEKNLTKLRKQVDNSDREIKDHKNIRNSVHHIIQQQIVVDFEFLWTVEVHIQNHKNDPKEVHDNERESTKAKME